MRWWHPVAAALVLGPIVFVAFVAIWWARCCRRLEWFELVDGAVAGRLVHVHKYARRWQQTVGDIVAPCAHLLRLDRIAVPSAEEADLRRAEALVRARQPRRIVRTSGTGPFFFVETEGCGEWRVHPDGVGGWAVEDVDAVGP